MSRVSYIDVKAAILERIRGGALVWKFRKKFHPLLQNT